MYNYSKLLPSLQGGMKRYIEEGIQPGGFLTAVICNNLRESFIRADDFNQAGMFEIVKWMYNEAPLTCWGSPQRMRLWMKMYNRCETEPLPEFPTK